MTKRLNSEQNLLEINDTELLALISEQGQIFELDLTYYAGGRKKLLISVHLLAQASGF